MSEKDMSNIGTEQPKNGGASDGSDALSPDLSSTIFQRKGTTQLDTSLNGGDVKKKRE